VHRPIDTVAFAELARAIERIDDPDPVSGDAGGIVRGFLGEHRVTGVSRGQALQDQLDRDSTFADALQTKINSLTTDFVNRDDPAQRSVLERDRQKAIAQLAKLKQGIIDDKKAIADLEEEARRAGVPPGWLR